MPAGSHPDRRLGTPSVRLAGTCTRPRQEKYGYYKFSLTLRMSPDRTAETFGATELMPMEAAPILRRYLAEHPRTVSAYFDVAKDDALEDFAAEAPRHPVFRLHVTGS